MTDAALRSAFASASLDFHVAIGCRATDIIGSAHVIFAHRTRISALQVSMEMDDLRKAMIELNAAFTRLDLAHSAMTVGETASKIREAVS